MEWSDENVRDRLENAFNPTVSHSLPSTLGFYIRVELIDRSPGRRIDDTPFVAKIEPVYKRGIIFLLPSVNRLSHYNLEYCFKPDNELDRNSQAIITGSSIKGIDSDYRLIDGNSTQYPIQEEDKNFLN